MKTVESYLPTLPRVPPENTPKYCEELDSIIESMDIVEAEWTL
jgi:hypothetical protein